MYPCVLQSTVGTHCQILSRLLLLSFFLLKSDTGCICLSGNLASVQSILGTMQLVPADSVSRLTVPYLAFKM